MLDRVPTVAEVRRVASNRTPHAASMCVAALARAALALGYRRLVSYTLFGEAGTSYRAAGWWPTSITDVAAGWMSHPRATGGSLAQPGRKVRWEFGPDALPADAEVAAAVRAAVGVVPVPVRPSDTPLFPHASARGAQGDEA